MYHVSTLLPFHEDDKQRVERKRHLGNDVVNVIFVDSFTQTFNPESIKTNFIRMLSNQSMLDLRRATCLAVHWVCDIYLRVWIWLVGWLVLWIWLVGWLV
jgi:hypothetical protein